MLAAQQGYSVVATASAFYLHEVETDYRMIALLSIIVVGISYVAQDMLCFVAIHVSVS